MRTQSEPPGLSVEGGEQQSLPSSPTSSAVTAVSGRSSMGMSLQFKGAWCTPPRIFMDHQVPLPSKWSYCEKLVLPMLDLRLKHSLILLFSRNNCVKLWLQELSLKRKISTTISIDYFIPLMKNLKQKKGRICFFFLLQFAMCTACSNYILWYFVFPSHNL